MQIAICDDMQKELETTRAALDTYAKANPALLQRMVFTKSVFCLLLISAYLLF